MPIQAKFPPSSNVFCLEDDTEVRNIRKTSGIGNGKPGEYFTRSVKAAIKEGVMEDYLKIPIRVHDHRCANIECGNHAAVAGHVWMDGVFKITKMYLVPICKACNNSQRMRFIVGQGSLVVEEERSSMKEVVKSAAKRFIDWKAEP